MPHVVVLPDEELVPARQACLESLKKKPGLAVTEFVLKLKS